MVLLEFNTFYYHQSNLSENSIEILENWKYLNNNSFKKGIIPQKMLSLQPEIRLQRFRDFRIGL